MPFTPSWQVWHLHVYKPLSGISNGPTPVVVLAAIGFGDLSTAFYNN